MNYKKSDPMSGSLFLEEGLILKFKGVDDALK